MQLKPYDINDMIHMIRLSPYHLKKYQKIMEQERTIVPEGNRIYFFAKRLNVEPSLVSKYFASVFILFMISITLFIYLRLTYSAHVHV